MQQKYAAKMRKREKNAHLVISTTKISRPNRGNHMLKTIAFMA